MRRWKLFEGVAAALALALAWAPGAQALDKVVAGKSVATSFAFCTLDVGVAAGIWKKEGIDLQIRAFHGAAQTQQALTAGAIDFGLGSGPSMAFSSKGAPDIGVAAIAGPPRNMALIVAPQIGIKAVDDLAGKKIGVTSAGSLTYWLVKELSRQKGWTGDKAIQPVPMGAMRTRLAAMKRGDIQGTVQTTTNGYELQEAGVAKVLVLFGDYIKHFHTHVMFARKELVGKNPDLVRRFLRGWFRTIARMKKDEDLTVRVVSRVMKIKPEIIRKTYPVVMSIMSDDGSFDPKAIEVIRRSLVELHILDKAPDPKKMYTTEFVPVRF